MKRQKKATIRQTSDYAMYNKLSIETDAVTPMSTSTSLLPTLTAPHMDTGSLSLVDLCQFSIYFFFAFK